MSPSQISWNIHGEESTYLLIHAEGFKEANACSGSQQGLAPHLTPSTAVDALCPHAKLQLEKHCTSRKLR